MTFIQPRSAMLCRKAWSALSKRDPTLRLPIPSSRSREIRPVGTDRFRQSTGLRQVYVTVILIQRRPSHAERSAGDVAAAAGHR
jgi:hypothetical protein